VRGARRDLVSIAQAVSARNDALHDAQLRGKARPPTPAEPVYRRSTLEQWSDAWRSKVDLADHFETQIAAKKAALKPKAPDGTTAERQRALLETFCTLLAADRDRLLREEPEVAHAVRTWPAYMSGTGRVQHKDFVSNALEREYPQELQEIRDSEESLAVLREVTSEVAEALDNERKALAAPPAPEPIVKCCQKNARRLSGVKVEISHNRHCRPLLRARHERPRCCCAAECGQQFPPSDGDCHTPLPCEVRKGNGTTLRVCCR
jgi:ParB-like chromosome segregation protein Spo0J